MAVPRSMGPAVFLGSPPTLNTHLVPPGVCGSWPLPTVGNLARTSPRKPRTPTARCRRSRAKPYQTTCACLQPDPPRSRQRPPQSTRSGRSSRPEIKMGTLSTHNHETLLECAAPGRSSQRDSHSSLGTNNTLVPPGVCGSWPLLAVWDPRFSRAHRETRNTHLVPPGVCGSWPLLAVCDPRFSWAHRPTHNTNCLKSRLNCCSIKHQLIMCARKKFATQVLEPEIPT